MDAGHHLHSETSILIPLLADILLQGRMLHVHHLLMELFCDGAVCLDKITDWPLSWLLGNASSVPPSILSRKGEKNISIFVFTSNLIVGRGLSCSYFHPESVIMIWFAFSVSGNLRRTEQSWTAVPFLTSHVSERQNQSYLDWSGVWGARDGFMAEAEAEAILQHWCFRMAQHVKAWSLSMQF